MMSSPLIFLEFDDVLLSEHERNRQSVEMAIAQDAIEELPALWRHLFNEEAKTNLRLLHLEFAPTYVITSSWTGFLSLDDTKAVLRLGRLGFVADHLEQTWYTYLGNASLRRAELELWMSAHHGRPYVVVDNVKGARSLADTRFMENTVVCSPDGGFDQLALGVARGILLNRNTTTHVWTVPA